MTLSWLKLNPVTRKRLKRFRTFRRAWISFWILIVLYGLSLCAELLCNNRPILMVYEGRLYAPVFRHYSEDQFLHNGSSLGADYRKLAAIKEFDDKTIMLWPLFRSDPSEQVPAAELEPYRRIAVFLTPVPGVGNATVTDGKLSLSAFEGGDTVVEPPEDGFAGHALAEFWTVPAVLTDAVRRRFANETSPELEIECKEKDGDGKAILRLLAFRKRRQAPKKVVIKVSSAGDELQQRTGKLRFERGQTRPSSGLSFWKTLDESARRSILDACNAAGRAVDTEESAAVFSASSVSGSGSNSSNENLLRIGGARYRLTCEFERIEHPHRPVKGHWLGMDDAGRDVLARILYGLRTSLTFGLILVVSSMLFGTMVGCLQGYFGGVADLLGQRVIEIWSALPFLYVVILMGSLFGTGFWLLIVCYALFNWISVSYYMRAEMLRLRRQPFVEAARCLGLPWWCIVLRHILPNALVPLVTFVPFSLVGAIGALAGLDYLGFGLPPPTPSLGQLLQQAQVQREAWWLIVYPSAALFVVMLLCVFIGEGVREAFDPRRQNRIQ